MKKFISLILSLSLLFLMAVPAFATSIEEGTDVLSEEFIFAEGPKVDGYSIDYRYFSPVNEDDTAKYPLVVWLHGMGDGAKDGKQVSASNISYWASDEFQARFTNGGAFILAARSREELGHCWTNTMIEPLKAAIDEFISKNSANIDISRIYVGGYSMGGKMTLKMAIAYPEMFAAAFPICPAWSPSEELLSHIADMPVWLTSGKPDPLVNYFFSVSKTWEKLTYVTNNPEEIRFSTLKRVCYEDGKRTMSSHHSWFAVNHDMFSDTNGAYPYMSTENGKGEEIILTFPEGMISWLCAHTSNYDGSASEGKGNLENATDTDNMNGTNGIFDFLKTLFKAITSLFGLI